MSEQDTRFSFPKEEERILSYWKEINAFEQSNKLNEGNKRFSFYDGPPFATGTPHYGHILASTIKDIIPRYANMNGMYVERRFGWDTHGLPVEHEIDKKLGITGKEDVMAMGIAKYNEECRSIVMRYAHAWKDTIGRLGRWIDFENDYKTLYPEFMESVWWVFKQLYEKDSVYRGLRVMPYSTGCTTPLSNFEAQQNYKDVNDPAVTVGFRLVDDENTFLVAWTTTPWTLPSNIALAVNPEFEYVKIYDEKTKKHYILLESLLKTLYRKPKNEKYKIVEKIKGSELVGLKYQPLFNYFYDKFKDHGFVVYGGDFVTDDSGTGIVHQAPAFGEVDFEAATAAGVIDEKRVPPNPVDDNGKFSSQVPDWEGVYVKDADTKIIKYLTEKGNILLSSQIRHSYPFCWRSDTPLLYRTVPAWFVRVKEIVPDMLKNVEATHWVPQTIKEKRFSNWIANARDWNVSRNRYWGTPIPLWVSDDFEEIVCIGSIQELRDLSGNQDITDIHREKIDDITIPSRQGKGVLRRIEEVFDCWFESGSMPYAQNHYPFEGKDEFSSKFPADFISEGLDQTRGWFYTLTVLGTHLFNTAPYKNVIVSGIVLAGDGKKMSKRLKNYPDPGIVLDGYGADALRLYLINSPVLRAETLKFKEEGVKEVVSKVLLPWWNSFKFLEGQVALLKKLNQIDYKYDPEVRSENVMDKWLLATIQSLIKFIHQEMAEYRLYTVVPKLLKLIDDLTNWYIRFNRRRLKGENGVDDCIKALNTLTEALFTLVRAMAPFTPFLSENIYQRLRPLIPDAVLSKYTKDPRSVHFLAYPVLNVSLFDEKIEIAMARMQKVIDYGRNIREKKTISLKTPLKTLVILHSDPGYLADVESLKSYITEELNVRDVIITSDEDKYGVAYGVVADWPVLGKKLKKDAQKVKVALPSVSSEEVKEFLKTGKITVAGIELSSEDLNAVRGLPESKSQDGHEVRSDRDTLVILDTKVYEELKTEGTARELVNRIQKLRKKASLDATDDVIVQYAITNDTIGLDSIMKQHADMLIKTCRRPLEPLAETSKDVIAEEECQIQDTLIKIRLLNI
ncbi:Isoleucyl-tRNA synthetase [Komagataella phaffii CBS 7435]|uniref:Isoleucine--tRNA ligase, cytoplasmic n=2 Tax=Komagataella phaffii TaxID=460519 RepID=C4R8P5_KOMPG|nr:Cytoplasmic isoleucine-tRNA synthetase, target of the G1-specific inhibitor reveromycin A [Komagataella phaffii GS115]AOA65214.1 GQ67_05089T0 [Komagataella phaffii]CAH2450627.1 Isoleucyl-tRNA synthetase [Komagataella phaffii CBS 7435]AOA69590.1 GQ68_05071T0 [Komagataella phaffii GS115]CAY71970.1 Cytoplasmic isoleucine-tRNA synthetase, target of the G1-specific inhibitor reveromycin A [Komagataella phaffii GS115]CCA40429.1 Isoleucyl-tRNA synthetase [Komagataella phaffii CBS 7435]